MSEASTEFGESMQSTDSNLSRRTVVKGAAWAVPAVAAAAAAPIAATTLQLVPGINGWMMNSRQQRSGGLGSRRWCGYDASWDSRTVSTPTPDGAPYGLYVYNPNLDDVITGAEMILWIPDFASNITWGTGMGHSSTCWGTPTDIGIHTKWDGLKYRGFKWTYNCSLDPNARVLDSDGHYRLYLATFNVSVSYRHSPYGNCSTWRYIAQRRVNINGEDKCFERRVSSLSGLINNNCSGGTLYSAAPAARSASVKAEDTSSEESAEGEEVEFGTVETSIC